ncbi:MAG: GreA/GreB family elongation factor [candidate division WOR-3 bacterium]
MTTNSEHSNLLVKIKEILRKKEFEKLESTFLECITEFEPSRYLSEYWKVIDYLNLPQKKLTHYAQELAMLVTEYLLEHNYYKEVIEHLAKLANLINVDQKLRQRIINAYRAVYAHQKNIDAFIRYVGLEETASFNQAIFNLNKLVKFDIGSAVYSSRFGYGEITKIDFLLDLITIKFSSKTQTITFDQAISSLQPIPKDNIFFLKEIKTEFLAQMVSNEPEKVIALLNRDLPTDYKISDVKRILRGIVSDQTIDILAKHLKTKLTKHQKECESKTFDYTILPSLTIDEILKIFNQIPNNIKQKLIKEIKTQRTDWHEVFLKLFFNQTDKRVLQTIYLTADEQFQKQLTERVFLEYKKYPIQFLSIAELSNFDQRLILNYYLDLAQIVDLKINKISLASEIRKKLIANNFKFIRTVVDKITVDDAPKILTQINSLKNLYPEERDAITKIIKQAFPEIFEIKDAYIYHTEIAIKNKQQELNLLLSEEIPKVAAEIGRARSYGDLRENFEYKAALEKQKRLINKVSELEQALAKAKPIDFSKVETDKVNIGTTVCLQPICDKNLPSVAYTILGPWDADLQKGIISYLAPLAQRLLNKKLGDEITDEQGTTYKIIMISKVEIV